MAAARPSTTGGVSLSYLIKQHPGVAKRIVEVPMVALCISAITAGELRYGLAKCPEAKRLHLAVKAFLLRGDVLPWDQTVADTFGML